ncbi:TPA: hypothetical protein DIC39_01260 [Patescibacteria group bacterium]|nr:hypothetical protein [Patescibacteria group bacterium]HCU47676.1 hypothetical protein [Patescibacteria group bacterium]
MPLPNEGIELLYTRDCDAWPEAKANLRAALDNLNIKAVISEVIMDTMDQAYIYNFFASPTIHINGVDVDPKGRRTSKRGLGKDRPYFYQGRAWPVPSVEMIAAALKELY